MKYTKKPFICGTNAANYPIKKPQFEVESEYGVITVLGEYKGVKNLRLRATENGIFLSIPYRFSVARAKEFVLLNADWIRKVYAKRLKKSRDLEENAVYLFGTKRKIIVEEGAAKAAKMDIYDGFILLRVPKGSDPNAVFLNEWTKYAEFFLMKTTYLAVMDYEEILGKTDFPKVQISLVKSYWGKCFYGENKIKFNAKLMQADEDCIKYVVCHELVHFKCHGHDAAFHAALRKICPNERELKRKLDKYSLNPFPPIVKL